MTFEHTRDDLRHWLIDIVLAAVQLLQRLHHEEPNRLVRALFHDGRRQTLVRAADTYQQRSNSGTAANRPSEVVDTEQIIELNLIK